MIFPIPLLTSPLKGEIMCVARDEFPHLQGEGKPCTTWGAGQSPESNMVQGVGVGCNAEGECQTSQTFICYALCGCGH